MGKNKTGTYLKYAIGEILLVVIGILIALNINNWNEARKEKILETTLLREVKSGIESDLIDLNNNIERSKLIHRDQEIFINWLESNQTYNDSLSSHIAGLYTSTYFASNKMPYEALKQLGMRTVKNDTLRNQIAKLYDIIYPDYVQFSDTYIEQINSLIEHSATHFNELTWDGRIIKPFNIKNLKTDHSYIFRLKTLKNANVLLYLWKMEKAKTEIELTLELLNARFKEE